MKLLIVTSATALLLAGCAATIESVSAAPPRTEQVRDRNYVVGVQRTVVVGQPLVRVREYVATTSEGAAFEVQSAAIARAGMGTARLAAGQRLPIIGERTIDGRRYAVAMTGGDMGLQVALDDGSVFNKVVVRNPYDGSFIPVLPDLNFDPAAPALVRITDSKRETGPTDVNFEIVFNGIDGDALRFQYREYTATDMARPAFSQDLSYPKTAERFRFRDLAIRVVRVGVDDLDYIVEAD